MDQPVVWIVNAEHWPRALLRAELIERRFDAVGYETCLDAVETLPWRQPAAVVVDVRGQPVKQVRRLLDLHVPVIVTGGAPDIDDPAYASGNWAVVMRRPVSIGAIADAVARALNPGDG